jgi:hypothetical protein
MSNSSLQESGARVANAAFARWPWLASVAGLEGERTAALSPSAFAEYNLPLQDNGNERTSGETFAPSGQCPIIICVFWAVKLRSYT